MLSSLVQNKHQLLIMMAMTIMADAMILMLVYPGLHPLLALNNKYPERVKDISLRLN